MADKPRSYEQFARDIFADCWHISKAPKATILEMIQETRDDIAVKIANDPELGILDKKLESFQNKIADIKEADLKKLKVLFSEEYDTLWTDLAPRFKKPGLVYNYDNIKEVITGSEFYRVVKKAADNKIIDIKPVDTMIEFVVIKNLATMRATPALEQVATVKTSDLSDEIKARADNIIKGAREANSSPLKPHQLQAKEKELELA